MKEIEEILKIHCPSMDILFLDQQGKEFRNRIFDAMKEYAEECVKASLEKASENVEIIIDSNPSLINYTSITKPENIILL